MLCLVMQVKIDRRRFLSYAGASLATSQLAGCGNDIIQTKGVPRSNFDDESTAEEVTAGVDLDGKLVVVTGCTSGIGFETMRVLALRGANVVGTSRSLERAQAACNKVIGTTTPVQLDLGDFESVVACAESIRSLNTPIDILVCNAGYLGGGNDLELINGIEKHFVINHLGHFILVNRVRRRCLRGQCSLDPFEVAHMAQWQGTCADLQRRRSRYAVGDNRRCGRANRHRGYLRAIAQNLHQSGI